MRKFYFLVALLAAASMSLRAEVISGSFEGADLDWAYNTDTKVLSFTITGDHPYIPNQTQNVSPWKDFRSEVLSLEIPEGVTQLGDYAFNGFSSIVDVVIPQSVTIINQYAFWDCYSLHTCTMGNAVTLFGQWAFSNCYSLTSLDIPNSAQEIRHQAFSNVPNIVYYDGRTENYGARSVNGFIEDDVVYRSASKDTLLACSASRSGALTVDDAVTLIAGNAFMHCVHLTNVNCGANVTKIGSYAFTGCDALETMTFGAALVELERYACQCQALKTVHCKATVPPAANSYAFYDVKQNKATLYVPAASVDAYKEASVWKNFGTILPETEGVEHVQADTQTIKRIENGRLIIEHENSIFTVDGTKIQ